MLSGLNLFRLRIKAPSARTEAFGGSEAWFYGFRLPFDARFNFNCCYLRHVGVTFKSLGTATKLGWVEGTRTPFNLLTFNFNFTPYLIFFNRSSPFIALSPTLQLQDTESMALLDAKVGLTHRGRGLLGPKCCSFDFSSIAFECYPGTPNLWPFESSYHRGQTVPIRRGCGSEASLA
ncbi:hypothetical protein C8R46DRAFT_1236658 [Mycena filopes]|nr:hypothetical protein C8R46DRAFT_1236658 [Mycena filopes]